MTIVNYAALDQLSHVGSLTPKSQGLGDAAALAIEAFAADNGWRYDRRADHIIADYEFGWAPAWTGMHGYVLTERSPSFGKWSMYGLSDAVI